MALTVLKMRASRGKNLLFSAAFLTVGLRGNGMEMMAKILRERVSLELERQLRPFRFDFGPRRYLGSRLRAIESNIPFRKLSDSGAE